MTQATIYDRNGWRVTSYGNGWAYMLEGYWTVAKGFKNIWFQDDDANDFRERTMGPDGFFVDNVEGRFSDYSEVMQ